MSKISKRLSSYINMVSPSFDSFDDVMAPGVAIAVFVTGQVSSVHGRYDDGSTAPLEESREELDFE